MNHLLYVLIHCLEMINGRGKIKCCQGVLWGIDNIKPFYKSGTKTGVGHNADRKQINKHAVLRPTAATQR